MWPLFPFVYPFGERKKVTFQKALVNYKSTMTIPKYLVLFVFMIAFLFYDSLSAVSKNEIKQNHCLSCHKTIYEKGVSSFYQHSPFEKKECVVCHLKQREGIAPVRDKGAVGVNMLESMTLCSRDYLEEHTIFLRELIPKAVYDINVVLRDMSRNTLRKEFRGVTPEKVQNIKTDDEKPPVISGIKVGPIKRAIFLETTITWDTDKPSTSYVKYWIPEQCWNVPEDNALTKHHQVTLYGLVAGKEYHFRVASKDIFGNEGISEDVVFNTETISKSSEVKETDNRKGGAVELAVNKMDIFLLDSALGLHLETTKPANVTVEYVKVEDPAVPNEPQIKPPVLKQYPELTSGKELAIDGCYQCHPPEELGVTHPVGVALKQTTKIPKDLPTLEGGIITCVTCHDVHGANRPYLARKEMTRDICISCHDGY